ncbi:MAG TPA: ATP-binding protein [Nocardioidaceae bacterium]|nr:ATP-binding protein [Nocardioidaceae bacterium]
MRNTPLSPSGVEQLVGYLRVFGLLAGVPLVLLTEFPDTAWFVLAVATLAALSALTLVLWLAPRWSSWRPGVFVHVGFGADVVVIIGLVLAFAHVQPNVSWAAVFTLLADAALRYGVWGAVVGLLLGGALFAAQVQLHAAATGQPVDPAGYLFAASTLVGVAGALAGFSHAVDRQHRTTDEHARTLADAERVRDRLLAASAHELQGSLTAVHLGADTVRMHADQMTPQQIRTTLDVVVRQSAYLRRLVSDLLSVARAHSEDVSLTSTTADVADTIDGALAAANRHRDQHLLELSVPRMVADLDHERLQQVVRNLVENAFKYTPPGGRVSLSAQHHGDVFELRVADSGPGIPSADRERIFEPFRRRADSSERADSVGLGLYLVKQIVDAMDGTLDLYTSSTGSEFVVRLPAVVES